MPNNWDKKPDEVEGVTVPIQSTIPQPETQVNKVPDALLRDKERLRKAALKNLEYMRKKELREIEQRLAEPSPVDTANTSGGSTASRASKRARLSRAGIGIGAVQNTSVYVTNLPPTVQSPLLGRVA